MINTVMVFAVLYTPQPLLPLLAREFQVSSSHAGLLMALALFPMAVAPLLYGHVVERWSARRVLNSALPLMAATELLFWWAPSFTWLLVGRLLQGLLLPAAITALMPWTSNLASPAGVRQVMGTYIALTIVGGFSGRAVTGALTDGLGWRSAFLFWGAGLLLGWLLLNRIPRDPQTQFRRLPWNALGQVLKQRAFLQPYLTTFLLFVGFSGLLNALPFRLKALNPELSESLVSLVYLGYLMGALMSVNAERLTRWTGGALGNIRWGLLSFGLGLGLLLLPQPGIAYGAMFVFSGGFFLTHATLSGMVNQQAQDNRGVVNGLYLAFYYGGGASGSYGPLLVYHQWGWLPFLAVVACCAGLALGLNLLLPPPMPR